MNVKHKLREYYPAFTHRNFKLFWTGQVISLIGSWMQNAALNWLVYSITNDRFLLGLMSAVQFTPLFLFSLYAGLVIEKYPKRKIIIATQTFQLIAAFLLFFMVFFNKTNYFLILLILFCIGTVQTFDNPARQAFVVEMVEGRAHLLNAIALNSAAFNGARLIGPAVAGRIMADLGVRWCFFLNAVSFIAVIIGLFMMKMEDKASKKDIINPRKEIIEGLKYIRKTPRLLYTIISTAIIPTFCINFNILVPPYTKDVLHLSEKAFGMLLSSLGLGALISALTVAAKGKKERAFLYQLIGSFGLSASLIITGLITNYHYALLSLAVCGFFMIMFTTTSNSVLQYYSPDEMRGRIMSVYSLVFGGLVPVGSLYAGTVSKFLGTNNAFIISGIIGFMGFLLLFSRRRELNDGKLRRNTQSS
ncbi:Predicted arabinose efflux permease, MFS family [Caloramator quimbayensis]|uniref:Predicted arabinose efflux permease, MFS family n=1 Tax=Caloramator quimbayensis TaxID=1147123 RepID=A0A1T4XI46_9CLOT|nr:MFS transporter [Caloramator quimbayensis]SKA89113.1 Predicted arabinose efflux permease, MFS family [Caloramator quimbayensis]